MDILLYRQSEVELPLRPHPMTPREQEVLNLLVDGLTNRAIAGSLYISEVTAKKHVQSIMGKLYAHNRTGAAVKALRAGLVDS